MTQRFITLLAMCAGCLLAGCGGKSQSGPAEFIERYGGEFLGSRFAKGMERMGYKRFVFSNARVGIDPNYGEYVEADVALKPAFGMKYYRRCAIPSARECVSGRFSSRLVRTLGESESRALETLLKGVVYEDRLAPVVYDPRPIDIERMVSPWGRLRIARAKDGEGVYHPVGEMKRAVHWFNPGSEEDDCDDIRVEPFATSPGGLVSSRIIDSVHALAAGREETSLAVTNYVLRLGRINEARDCLEKAACDLDRMRETSYDGKVKRPSWIVIRVRAERVKGQSEIEKLRGEAEARRRGIGDRIYSLERGLRRKGRDARDAAQNAERAVRDLNAATNALAGIEADRAAGRRRRGHSYGKLEKLRKFVSESGPANIAATRKRSEEARAALEETEAKIAELRAELERQSRVDAARLAEAEAAAKRKLGDREKELERDYRKEVERLEKILFSCADQFRKAIGAN